MRRSHVAGVKRIYVFSNIVISKRLLAFLVVASLLNLGLIYMILLSKLSSPGTSQESIFFVFVVGLYRVLMLNYAATIAREVKSSEIQLYLAHTLRRLEYVATALIVIDLLPLITQLAPYLAFLGVIEPSLLLRGETLSLVPLLLVDFTICASIYTLVASRGRDTLLVIIGVVMALLSILITPLSISMVAYGRDISLTIGYLGSLITSILAPYAYSVAYNLYAHPPNPYQPLNPDFYTLPSPTIMSIISLTTSIFVLVATILWFKRRDV
jgi:predicted Na+-dependent transporter